MKGLQRGAMLVCILSLVIISACAKDQAQPEKLKTTKTTEEAVEEKIPPATKTVEEMVDQQAGVLVETHMDQQLKHWKAGTVSSTEIF